MEEEVKRTREGWGEGSHMEGGTEERQKEVKRRNSEERFSGM